MKPIKRIPHISGTYLISLQIFTECYKIITFIWGRKGGGVDLKNVYLSEAQTKQTLLDLKQVIFLIIYFRRSFKDISPFLLAPTCVFLASKVEEFHLLNLTKIVSATSNASKFN